VFRNRSRTSIKLLVYDGQGYWLCQKRLSTGKFTWWPAQGANLPMTRLQAHQLHVLLYGGDPANTRAAPVWRPVDGHD
jgi:transposase